MIGRWIDGLTDEQRDRIVTASGWCTRRAEDRDGSRCLLGNAFPGAVLPSCTIDWAVWETPILGHSWLKQSHVAMRFDSLCIRFGLDRIVRAIKLRAGAKVPAEVSEHTPEHA